MPLTDVAIRKAKPTDQVAKLRDGGGLYLLLRPDGGRWWRFDYRRPVTGKRNTLSLGTYPDTDLASARAKRNGARKLLAEGIDPGAQRVAEKAAKVAASAGTFAAVAAEWFAQHGHTLTTGTFKRDSALIANHLLPWIGDTPVGDVTPPQLLAALRRIQATGHLETAHRARSLAGKLFRYAVATGRAERNPATDLIGAVPQPDKQHFASLTEPAQVKPLLIALHSYQGTPIVVAALKLAPLVFVRPGELRHARWADIDLDAAEWRYIASKTKTPHVVPLASQAVEILRDLQPLTGRGEYVFPSARGKSRPMSDNAILIALRALGFDSETMSGHGFRAMARTILDEVLGFRPDYIEHQLAHAVRDPNGRAYNRTAHLPERRKMMQAWADYLDALRTAANVVPIKHAAMR